MSEQIRSGPNSEQVAAGVGPRLLIAGYDGTDSAAHALAYAAGLAERTGAHLLVVTVDSVPVALGYVPVPPAYIDSVKRAVGECIGTARCSYEVALLTGNPAMMIEAIADGRHADLLVLGRPRRPLLHLLGSVPAQLARRAHRPVVVVP